MFLFWYIKTPSFRNVAADLCLVQCTFVIIIFSHLTQNGTLAPLRAHFLTLHPLDLHEQATLHVYHHSPAPSKG